MIVSDPAFSDESGIISRSLSGKAQAKMNALVQTVIKESYVEMENLLNEREEKRRGWENRERDPIYHKCDPEILPMTVPLDSVVNIWQPYKAFLASINPSKGKSWMEVILHAIEMIPKWSASFQPKVCAET